jgi:hypothetical protein
MATGRVPTTANSPLTAKGDLFTYSTAPARLAVGNNGETIVADSSTSTGLRYTAGNPISNPVINSCFDIWQRGTSVATGAAAAYTADRWYALRDSFVAGLTVSRQATNDTTNLPFIQYCARVQRDSGNTGTQLVWFSNNFETSNSVPFAGKTVTLSFYARAGANYSSASSALGVRLYSGTGTDQNIVSGYTGQALPIDTTVTLTTTWQRFSITTAAAVASTATELAIRLAFTPSGTAGAADFFETTGVQIDIGSVALPVRRNGATIQGELAACQRYFTAITGNGNGNAASPVTNFGTAYSTTRVEAVLPLPVTMRTAPSVSFSGATDFRIYDTVNAALITTSMALGSVGSQPNGVIIQANVASGATQYRPYYVIPKDSTVATIYLNSEL